MPDLDAATTAAVATARANGFNTPNVNGVTDPSNDVEITTSGSGRRLRVQIRDRKVETVLASIFMDDINMRRSASAEWAPPVPLGSPTNYFGTGNMMPGLAPSEQYGVWASVNGWCAAKEQGDRFLSRFDGNERFRVITPRPEDASLPDDPPIWLQTGVCPSAELNPQYNDDYYKYVIDIPDARTVPVEVFVYDGAYVPVEDLSLIPSPKMDGTLSYDEGVVDQWEADGRPTRYPDFEHFTDTDFRLYGPDATPSDESDNPEFGIDIPCGAGEPMPYTFLSNDTSAYNYTAGAPGDLWHSNRWRRLCTLPAVPGRYILHVSTRAGQLKSYTSNSYGLALGNGFGDVVACSALTDPTCPQISGQDAVSVDNEFPASTADFYLASIDPSYAVHKMEIDLWDPGEGSWKIQLLDPNGNLAQFQYDDIFNNEYDPAYTVDDGLYARSPTVTEIDLGPVPPPRDPPPVLPGGQPQPGPINTRASRWRYSDRLVRMYVDLPNDYTGVYGQNT